MTDPAFPAEPFTHAERITLAASPLAVVRHEGVRVSDVPALFDTDYGAIALLFGAGELVPTLSDPSEAPPQLRTDLIMPVRV